MAVSVKLAKKPVIGGDALAYEAQITVSGLDATKTYTILFGINHTPRVNLLYNGSRNDEGFWARKTNGSFTTSDDVVSGITTKTYIFKIKELNSNNLLSATSLTFRAGSAELGFWVQLNNRIITPVVDITPIAPDTTGPVITIKSPTANQDIVKGLFPVAASGTSIDAVDGDISSGIVWKITNRTVGTKTLSSSEAANLQNLAVGAYALTAESTDAAGNKTTLVGPTFNVVNPPSTPTAYVIPIKNQASGTTSITFKAAYAGLVDNATYTLQVGVGNLHTKLEKDKSQGISSSANRTGTIDLTVTGLTDGPHSYGVTLINADGTTAFRTTILKFQIGESPTITITSPVDKTTYPKGTAPAIDLEATAKDQNNKVLTPVWKDVTDPDNIKNPINAINVKLWPAGTYTLRASATDQHGLTAQKEITITIVSTDVTVTITSPKPGYSRIINTIPIVPAATAVGADGKDLTSTIKWYLDGSRSTTSGSALLRLQLGRIGTHTLRAEATDSRYNTKGEASISYTILAIPSGDLVMAEGLKDGVGTSLTWPILVWGYTDNQTPGRQAVSMYIHGFFRKTHNADGTAISSPTWDSFLWERSTGWAVRRGSVAGYVNIGQFNRPRPSELSSDRKKFTMSQGQWQFRFFMTNGQSPNDINPETNGLKSGLSRSRLLHAKSENIVLVGPDTTKPVITISSPTANQQIISGAITDANPITVNAVAKAIDSHDGNISSKITWRDITGLNNPIDLKVTGDTVSNLQNLRAGSYTYEASVTDQAGNTGKATISFSIIIPDDTTPPVITITSPTPNQDIRINTTFNLTATAADARQGTVTIAWFKVTTDNANNEVLTKQTKLTGISFASAGRHTYEVQATDPSGNVAKKRVSVNIILGPDETKPALGINSPVNNQVIGNHQAFNLVAIATDDRDGDISSKVKWRDVTDSENPINLTKTVGVIVATVGTYTYEASVTDRAGNTAKATVTFIIRDLQAPNVTITSPIAGSTFVVNEPIVLAGTSIDAVDGDISSGIVWTLDGQTVTSPITLPKIGTYTITATSKDSRNNSKSVTVSISAGHGFELTFRRVALVRLIAGLATSIKNPAIAQRIGLDTPTGFDFINRRITRDSKDYEYSSALLIGDILAGANLASRSLSDNQGVFDRLREVYPDIVRALLDTSPATFKTTADVIEQDKKGTF